MQNAKLERVQVMHQYIHRSCDTDTCKTYFYRFFTTEHTIFVAHTLKCSYSWLPAIIYFDIQSEFQWHCLQRQPLTARAMQGEIIC